MGLGSKARGAAGSKARPGERKPSHSRVDRLGEQEYPGAQDRDKGEVIILISKPAHPLVFPVAINGRYNKPIALNRNLAVILSTSFLVFPVVMYGCESWTVKKAEHQRIDAFELWC